MKINSYIKKHSSLLIAFLSISVLYFIFYISGIGCPIKFLTGISCPRCGMTRACFNCLTLDFKEAFYLHPLCVTLTPTVVSLLIFKRKKMKKSFKAVIVVFCVLLVTTYFIRLFSHHPIVVFCPKDSIFYKIFRRFFK